MLGGGTIVVGVSYYGESIGYLLDLEVTDQAMNPRNSTVIIRYKSYAFIKPIPDNELSDIDFDKKILDSFKTLKPMNDFLNSVFKE